MGFSKLVQHLVTGQSEKKYFKRLDLQPGIPQQSLAKGTGYFQFRLCEMYLRNRRVLWQNYIPMTVAHLEFSYDGKPKSVPVYMGNNLLEPLGDLVEGQDIEYYNTNIIGPTPYLGGDIAFFLGLFRVEASDVSAGLFKFAETLIGTFNMGQLSAYMEMAESIKKGLSGLLGLDGVKLQIGNRTVFQNTPASPHFLKDGYLIYINCPEGFVENMDQLSVKDDRLYAGNSPYRDQDFCLVKIECTDKRQDYRELGFTERYLKARTEIYKNNEAQATAFFLPLIDDLADCPDLTPDHRFRLIQAYTANYEKEWDIRRNRSTSGPAKAKAVRGPRTNMNAAQVLQHMASTANKTGLSEDAENGLFDLGRHIDKIISHPADNDRELNRQIDKIASITPIKKPDSHGLATAIRSAYAEN